VIKLHKDKKSSI